LFGTLPVPDFVQKGGKIWKPRANFLIDLYPELQLQSNPHITVLYIYMNIFYWCEWFTLEICQSILDTLTILRILGNEVMRILFWPKWAEQKCIIRCFMTIAPVRYSHKDTIVFDKPSRLW